jgi:hypothetical protein
VGSGTIFLDDLTAINGREAYDLRLRRGDAALDVLWSPPGAPVAINTTVTSARVIARDGAQTTQQAVERQLRFVLSGAPVYVLHSR